MLEAIGRRPLMAAWLTVLVWLLVNVLFKAIGGSALDIDSAEQVYFAQSWQLGYGIRQPPLYTWMLLALRPDGGSWPVALEIARYAVLLAWLAGTQALARACGASPGRQALVVVSHLGFLLAMWRVHDSLTHTALAAALTTWAAAMAVRALRQPGWWPVVAVLAGLACLAKLNAVVWCVTALGAWAWLQWRTRARTPRARLVQSGLVEGRAGWLVHGRWLLLSGLVFMVMVAPYARWWWHQRQAGALARHIVQASEAVPFWEPVVLLALSALEYVFITPVILAVLAWWLSRRPGVLLPARRDASTWLRVQALMGLVVLGVAVTLMHGSHFAPRWLWPVWPGLTVCMVLWACDVAAAHDRHTGRPVWVRRFGMIAAGVAVLSIALAAVRWAGEVRSAQRCHNCWTDRPAIAFSHALHQWHGQPLRIVTGDDHLAGILVAADARDLTWSAVSPDLPPPQGFASTPWTCVAAWVDMDEPGAQPGALQALTRGAWLGPIQHQTWLLRRAPNRRLWLQSVILDPAVCNRAPR